MPNYHAINSPQNSIKTQCRLSDIVTCEITINKSDMVESFIKHYSLHNKVK